MHIDPSKIPSADEAWAALCRRSLYKFVQQFWEVIIPEDPIWNWHIKYLCDEIQEVIMRVVKREDKLYDLPINIPPGSSKSTICTIMAPAWAWTVDPTLRILTGSYSQSLSTDHALKSRDIILSDKYKKYFPEIDIKVDQNNKTHYTNTKKGERYATSVTGTITGFHAHLIIIDDPLNAQQSASEAELETANSFMNTTLSTRKVNKAVTPTILVMQRLHENDPTGNWLKKSDKKIKHICLPATANKGIKPIEVAEKYVDGLLDPIRMNAEILSEMKIDLGSYGYAGQMEQNPSPEEGGIWKKWLIVVPDHEMPERRELKDYGTDWDTAYTDKPGNASSAYVVSGLKNNKMYIDNIGWFNLEFPDLIKEMTFLPSPHYIEAKASGKSAKQTLVRAGITAIEVQVNSDKTARARDATPKAEAGMVYCRASLIDKIYNDNEQGILKFPNGYKQDLADTLAQAIQRHFAKFRSPAKARLPYLGDNHFVSEFDKVC